MSAGSLTPGLLCASDAVVVISHLISPHSWQFCVVDCMEGTWQKNAVLSVVSTRIHSADEIKGREGILYKEQALGYRKGWKQAGEMA